MSKHLYYRNGVEISEAEALDHCGVLRDRITMRVPTTMRDAADARVQAYDAYDAEIQQRWRNKRDADPWSETNPRGKSSEASGQGERGTPRGQQPGDVCTVNGAEGRLRMVNGKLQCVQPRSSSNSAAKFTDGVNTLDFRKGGRPGWRIPLHVSDTAQLRVDDAHRRYQNDLINRWRCGDQERACPQCDGAGELDGDDCEVCGGRGYLPAGGYECNAEAALENTATHHESLDHRRDSLADQMRTHQSRMRKIYADADRELENAWRQK
jgi:hypothetical protein